MSYAQLNRRANQLAHYLLEQNLLEERRVGLCVERSFDLVIGILGILKAGGAYVPLEPGQPAARAQGMLEDAGVDCLLTHTALRGRFQAREIVCLDDAGTRALLRTYPENDPADPDEDPARLAYLMYTSGSTGQPKGVEMPYTAANNHLNSIQHHCALLRQPFTTLQYVSAGFDMCFTDIFLALTTGGKLVLIEPAAHADLGRLLDLIAAQRIERLNLPYAVLHTLAVLSEQEGRYFPRLRVVLSSAEQLRITPALRAFFKRHADCRLVNHYGPTETHVVTAHALPAAVEIWPVLPPIGELLSNVRGYVLNAGGGLAPRGGIGELCIGGMALARGYRNRAALTEAKFGLDPESGERIYRTGDLVRWRADGCLEYLGRIDRQVKIRGFRVELGEIESQLSLHEMVEDNVIIAREVPKQGIKLLAYVVIRKQYSNGKDTETLLKTYLQASLPAYMLPSVFIFLQALPLTPNGKINREALPLPDFSERSDHHSVSARNEKEMQVITIWSELLGIDDIGVDDNFFEIGGHSLLLVRLLAEINRCFKSSLRLRDLFQAPTVAAIAELLPDKMGDGT